MLFCIGRLNALGTVGSTDDFSSVLAALQGVYGVYVNTDSFTIGEEKEVFTGIRIFELAKQVPTIRHYVWSNLEYISKVVTVYMTFHDNITNAYAG